MIASSVVAATALLTFINAVRTNRPRLHVQLDGPDADRTFKISVQNLGRQGQILVACGLLAGKRNLSTTPMKDDALPHRLPEADFRSFGVKLAGKHPPFDEVTGAWVSTADGKRFESRQRSADTGTPPPPPPGPSPRARARITTAIFAVAIYALIWSIRPPIPCTTLVVASSNEKASLMTFIANGFNNRPTPALLGLGPCNDVQVNRLESGTVEAALARGWDLPEPPPDVWAPASMSWARLLSHDLRAAGKPELVPPNPARIAQSPLVIGMPSPKVRALAWQDQVRDKKWKDIFALAKDPAIWAEPSWDGFRVTKTNPTVSTSGLHTLIAQYAITTGGWSPTCEGVAAVQPDVRDMEKSAVAYSAASTVRTLLDDLYRADQANTVLSFASAIPMEEAQLWQYNQGNPQFVWTRQNEDPLPRPRPKVQLVALYPADGTLVADHPYIVLESVTNSEKRRLATQFLEYLLDPRQQALFREAGFRDQSGQLGEGKDTEGNLDRRGPPRTQDAPTADAVRCILDSWPRVRSGIRVTSPELSV